MTVLFTFILVLAFQSTLRVKAGSAAFPQVLTEFELSRVRSGDTKINTEMQEHSA